MAAGNDAVDDGLTRLVAAFERLATAAERAVGLWEKQMAMGAKLSAAVLQMQGGAEPGLEPILQTLVDALSGISDTTNGGER